MESSGHKAVSQDGRMGLHAPHSRSSPASDSDSEGCGSGRRRWSVRSRSFGKLQEWGQYAERICEERMLRREQQTLLDAALPRLWAQRDCPWCWTRGRLRDWELWTDALTRDAAAAASEAPRGQDHVGSDAYSQPLPQLRRMPAPLPWCKRGEGREWHQLQ